MKLALKLWIPLPPAALHPNSRVHWRKKASVARKYRADVKLLTTVAIRCLSSLHVTLPLKDATVFVTFSWPDKRRRDEDGAMASLKAAFDGLQDAGVVENDRDLHHLFASSGFGKRKDAGVLLAIKEGNYHELIERLMEGLEV